MNGNNDTKYPAIISCIRQRYKKQMPLYEIDLFILKTIIFFR